jgi:hypothetical protein
VDEVVTGIIGLLVGGTGGWLLNNVVRRPWSFALSNVVSRNIPDNEPVSTVLVVAAEGSNTTVTPKLTAVRLLRPDRTLDESYTFAGPDAARVRDEKIALGDLTNTTLVLEVRQAGKAVVVDLTGWELEVAAGRLGCHASPGCHAEVVSGSRLRCPQ